MSQSYRLRFERASLKLKVATRIPARFTAASPLVLSTTGGIYALSLDVNTLTDDLSTTFQPIENNDQEITSGSTASVNENANTVRVNKTVGGAITLTLPAAISKISAVLIADWKGDAGTNNITITPSGSETIQGLSDWTIASDNGSIFLRPIPGVGYAI